MRVRIPRRLFAAWSIPPITALALLVATPLAAVPSGDGDLDGIPDWLELALAQRFFPTLNLHCGTFEGMAKADRRQLYGHDVPGYVNSANGKIPFVAHPYSPGNGTDCAEAFQCIEIRYGIAWNWDLGDDFWGGAHRGDSETYAILVARKDTDGSDWGVSWDVARLDAYQWRLMKEFMSAHWGSAGDSSSFRSHGNSGSTLYHRVWCAEGKHAMYPTQSACNGGGYANADDCSDNRCDIPDDVYTDVQNVGELAVPLDRYIPSPASSKYQSPSGTYDVWGTQKFGTATAYKDHLTRGLNWCRGYQYCLSDCGSWPPAECNPGDWSYGTCLQDCGYGPEQGGQLCEEVRCY